jgi:hypothetical protein
MSTPAEIIYSEPAALIPTANGNGHHAEVPMPLTQINGHVPAAFAPGAFAAEVEALESYGPDISKNTLGQLPRNLLRNIGSYRWFSREKETLAQTTFRGALAAAAHNHCELLSFALTAIIDLYNNDRALHASSLLYAMPPILGADIPQVPNGWSPGAGYQFQRTIRPLKSWTTGTPFSILPAVVTVLEQEMPDQMLVVTYQRRERQQLTIDDPIIYATYGPWHVKVAEWD